MKPKYLAAFAATGLLAWAAWQRFKIETPAAAAPSLADTVKYRLAAAMVESQLDAQFGTHDPAKVPDYLPNVLRIGAGLGSTFA